MSTATIHRKRATNGAKSRSAMRLLPLLNGDHLTVPEFERRYQTMPEDKKAELIEGIVVMSPPISNTHGEAQFTLGLILKRYANATAGVKCGGNISIRLDGKNEYQPDGLLRIATGPSARSHITSNDLLEGAPEFIVEITVSSASYDLHEKKAVYQRNGVAEYFVWQVMDSQIHWFALENGEYVELKAASDGVIKSRVFPGLWINTRALLANDDDKVLRALDKGLKSAEHAALVKKLSAK
ncbi:MAG: Uma2 family endonuclease [Verrucomicrobiota bacterium]